LVEIGDGIGYMGARADEICDAIGFRGVGFLKNCGWIEWFGNFITGFLCFFFFYFLLSKESRKGKKR
jgi:hypothetical protein